MGALGAVVDAKVFDEGVVVIGCGLEHDHRLTTYDPDRYPAWNCDGCRCIGVVAVSVLSRSAQSGTVAPQIYDLALGVDRFAPGEHGDELLYSTLAGLAALSGSNPVQDRVAV